MSSVSVMDFVAVVAMKIMAAAMAATLVPYDAVDVVVAVATTWFFVIYLTFRSDSMANLAISAKGLSPPRLPKKVFAVGFVGGSSHRLRGKGR